MILMCTYLKKLKVYKHNLLKTANTVCEEKYEEAEAKWGSEYGKDDTHAGIRPG